MKWLLPILLFLSCATPSPVVCPSCPPIPAPIHDTTTITKIDTVKEIEFDTLHSAIDTVTQIVYADTSNQPISAASFGLSIARLDNSLPIQEAGDYIIAHPGTCSTILLIPAGYYPCLTPIFWQKYNALVNQYLPFTIRVYGQSTWRCADGYGTTLFFGNCTTCAFEMGAQGMYGGTISGITFYGRWDDPGLSGYAFYTANGLGNGVCKNTPNGPEAAIVIDPFGPLPPPDGIGYTGVNAYGDSLKTFYRGQTGGSSSNEIVNIKFQHQLIDIILSPNGYTKNNESNIFHYLSSEWGRWFFIGCQPEEKANVIEHIDIGGPCETVFQLAHGWGQGQPGQYACAHWNLNGPIQRILYIVDQGFFRETFDDITAEDLGSIGMFVSNNGSTFNGKIDFADYIDETFQYLYPQIQGAGVHYKGQYRMYGTYNPITVNNLNGFNYFEDCGFDKVPYYNNDYNVAGSHPVFQNCTIGGMQTDSPVGIPIPIDSTAPGQNVSYLINDSLVGLFRQATIICQGNELQRISVGSILIAYNGTAPYAQQGVAGIVTSVSVSANSFVLNYIPSQIISGQRYYLSLWTQKL